MLPCHHFASGLFLASSPVVRRGRIELPYLGHKNIQHTVRYTELAPERFKNFWRDLKTGRGLHEYAKQAVVPASITVDAHELVMRVSPQATKCSIVCSSTAL